MINVTEAAVREMKRLLKDRDLNGYGLRVGVKGGGCSGLTYVMDFEAKPTDHDRVFEADGVSIFCDPKSYLYLNGLTLDYSNELMGGGFRFSNPNAQRTCSCGTSFSA
ncbi:MAG TPA: iron-sulfur cluster assembly accessory protein [Candidatus Sumerlaeota bacterium]|nr:MAG: Iron-binding protein IscA [candidate division BRC1 bacterium ADurb.BinA292]HOE95639.1 iron-sulfur cluster assembly accessory protein [Candidatus Sumerlaeota bacterium]HOR27478.1 iron-sulfur cluster assembly accessory protein [Candidatus Sumerlaeota bacterium]HPK04242.1 iron-sulfur cluster assembly accessory protein [Candidatus Sumerlaeota bacterium]